MPAKSEVRSYRFRSGLGLPGNTCLEFARNWNQMRSLDGLGRIFGVGCLPTPNKDLWNLFVNIEVAGPRRLFSFVGDWRPAATNVTREGQYDCTRQLVNMQDGYWVRSISGFRKWEENTSHEIMPYVLDSGFGPFDGRMGCEAANGQERPRFEFAEGLIGTADCAVAAESQDMDRLNTNARFYRVGEKVNFLVRVRFDHTRQDDPGNIKIHWVGRKNRKPVGEDGGVFMSEVRDNPNVLAIPNGYEISTLMHEFRQEDVGDYTGYMELLDDQDRLICATDALWFSVLQGH